MLQNRLYRGEIVHKDQCYPGLHDAIIDQELWDQVQKRLAEKRVERSSGAGASEPSLLAPDIVKTILRDAHPVELTAKRLAGKSRLPLNWREQRSYLRLD